MEKNGRVVTIPGYGMNRSRLAHFFESACALVRGMEWLAARNEKLAIEEADRIFVVWRGDPDFDSRWLSTKVSFQWDGPASGLLERLSMFFDFTFEERGKVPKEPVMVDYWARNVSLLVVLRWVGFCAKAKGAWIVVDSILGQVELVYPARASGKEGEEMA